MDFIDLTLPTPAENLALDDALLERAESSCDAKETLRVWLPGSPCVVLGRSSRVALEVDQDAAARESIPVLRRISGGASVVAGPGCLFYALVLSLVERPQLRMLDQAHQFVMSRMQTALRAYIPAVAWEGTCDLVLNNKKISGNSVRVARDWLLYHGSLLLDMDLGQVERLLRHPPREPDYRQGRSHSAFIGNCHLSSESVVEALRLVWRAGDTMTTIPGPRVAELVREKYSQPSWNLQR